MLCRLRRTSTYGGEITESIESPHPSLLSFLPCIYTLYPSTQLRFPTGPFCSSCLAFRTSRSFSSEGAEAGTGGTAGACGMRGNERDREKRRENERDRKGERREKGGRDERSMSSCPNLIIDVPRLDRVVESCWEGAWTRAQSSHQSYPRVICRVG